MPLFHDDECTKPTRYKEYLTKFVDKVHAHVFENRVDYLGKKFAKYDEKMTRMAFSDAQGGAGMTESRCFCVSCSATRRTP